MPRSSGTPGQSAGESSRPELTLLEVLRRAAAYLETHGSSSPRLDAELLLAHSLRLRRLDLYLQFERRLAEADLAGYRELVGRCRSGEPVAYILGRKEFMKLDFEVSPNVFVPNPDTETLVLLAIERGRRFGSGVRVADVGTGSGCVAVAVAHYLAAARVWASEVEEAALAVAAANVCRHKLQERVTLRQGHLLEPLPDGLEIICANLPYLDPAVKLPREVLAQPRRALFAADGGAELVSRLLQAAPSKLAPAGVVLAEISAGLAERFDLAAYSGHRLHRDLSGQIRVLEAWL